MSEGMQMVPGFNDPIWKALLTPPSRVPPSFAGRPCLGAPVPMKREAVSSSEEAVRRALYSAALDLVSTAGLHRQCGQPCPVPPQRYQQPHHHSAQQQMAAQQQQQQQQQQKARVTYSELMARRQQLTVPDNPHCLRHSAPVGSFVTSPLVSDLHDGTPPLHRSPV